MRILGSVVAPSAALMAFCNSKMTGCGGIRSQLICDELVWDKAIFLQQLAHQFQRGTLVSSALDQHVEHFALTIPGLGPVTASAMAASVQDVSAFSGPREFAAFLGLTPRQNSSGGKERLGRVSKMGNRYLRKLLVVGAHAVLYHRKPHDDALRSFAKKLMQSKPFKLVAVALANKMARIAFAILRGRTTYGTASP